MSRVVNGKALKPQACPEFKFRKGIVECAFLYFLGKSFAKKPIFREEAKANG